VVGSVEPHYFAGFTGGRKAFLPGVAAYETVRRNHSHAMNSGSRLMALEGNPVHEDMMEALRLLEDARAVKKNADGVVRGLPGEAGRTGIFAIMTVLDSSHRICGAYAGGIRATFSAAVEKSRGIYSVPVDGRYDIVVAVAEAPSDSDLYQAHKAIESGKLALKEHGILIVAAACGEGLGNDAFVCQLSSCSRPEDVAREMGLEYKLGDHKAAKLAELLLSSEVWAVSELPDETVRSIFFKPASGLQAAVDEALAAKGPGARVLVIRDAAVTIPRLPRARASSGAAIPRT
jgi:nickel-dependent lactate racemase